MADGSFSSGQTGKPQQTADEDAPTPDAAAPSHAFKAARDNASEFSDYASHYVAAQVDKLKISLRDLVLAAIVAVLGAITAAVLLVIGAIWLVRGIVDVLTSALSGNRGLAELSAGGIVVGGGWLAVFFCIWCIRRSSLNKTMRKYESRRQRQRDRFGHDISTPKTD